MSKIIELLEIDENKTPLREMTDDFNSIVAAGVELAISLKDKNKTWLFIAHLMNSKHAHDDVLKLREMAAKAFPVNKNDGFNMSL